MIELVVSGIGLGIALSFLTGPVFFALIKTSIEKGFLAGVALASGVVLSDAIYVAITLFGTSLIDLETKYHMQIGILGSAFLLFIGLYYVFKKVKFNYQTKQLPSIKHAGYFLKGFLMCMLNPFILLYWISVTSGVYTLKGHLEKNDLIVFFGTILIVLFSMDVLKAFYANKLRSKIKSTYIVKLNRVAGVLIIIFALKLIYNLVFTSKLF
ncbi:MAG: LysE family translocator [Sphingobacteriales bacterium]|nr:MAG: LysE family translocator [Sphingobacteriales bacterium]